MKRKTGLVFAAGCACMLLLAAGVNGIFNNITASGWINSATGYQLAGGAGTTGQTLCSDGTYFDTPCNPGGTGTLVEVNGGSSLGTANFNGTTPAAITGNQNVTWQISGSSVSAYVPVGFYNTVELANTAQTQRLALNFTGGLFAATDSSSPSRTGISLVTAPGGSGAAAVASYPSGGPGTSTALAAFDGNGNLIPASLVVPLTCNANGCYQVDWDGVYHEYGQASSGVTGDVPVTLPHSLPTAFLSITFGSDNTGADAGRNSCYVSAYSGTSGFTASSGGSTNNCWWHVDGH